MKKTMYVLTMVAFLMAIGIGSANAYPNQLDWVGHVNFDGPNLSWSVMDGDLPSGSPISQAPDNWDGVINGFDPIDDAVFGDAGLEYVQMADLTVDVGSKVVDGFVTTYSFDPDVYTEGFKVFDDDDTLLFQADLKPVELSVYGSMGGINPMFTASLFNITAGAGYVAGSSGIVDSYLTAPAGEWMITTQFGREDIIDIIENQGSGNFSYSGIADPVPEPATMLLLGSGLVGMAGLRRRKMRK